MLPCASINNVSLVFSLDSPLGIKSLQLPITSRRAAILVEAFGAEGATPFFPKDERQGILHNCTQFHQPKSKIARNMFTSNISNIFKYHNVYTTKWMGCWIFRIRQLLRDALNEAKDPLGSYLEDQVACFYLKNWQVSNWRKWNKGQDSESHERTWVTWPDWLL